MTNREASKAGTLGAVFVLVYPYWILRLRTGNRILAMGTL